MGKPSSDVSSDHSCNDELLKKSRHVSGESLTLPNMVSNSAVATWLHFLQMDQYLTEFLDNGYDDLETAKKIGSEDLEAIGVEDAHHKMFLLDAVRVLREQGAAWVYLLEASQTIISDSGFGSGDPGDRASAGSSGIASLPWTDHEASSSGDNSTCSSSKLRNCKVTPNKTKCLVEVTPEHHAQQHQRQTLQSQSQHSSPAISSASHRFNNSFRPNTVSSRPSIYDQQDQHDQQDLIQRVSELNSARLQLKNQQHQQSQNQQSSSQNQQSQNSLHTSHRQNQLQPQKQPQSQLNSSQLNSSQLNSSQLNSSSSCSPQKQQPHCDQDFIQLCSLVKDKLNREGISLAAPPFTTKAGDGYLAGLAARFASEFNLDEDDVLHQLEDLRSVATSDCWAPTAATSARARRLSETETHNYANFPGMAHGNHMNSDDKNFLPGIYASSSCLSDKDEDDIYDFAAKYEGAGKHHIFWNGNKPRVSPGWCNKFAKKAMTLRRNDGPQPSTYAISGTSSAFSSPLPIHNGFSTRTRLRPGGPQSSQQLQNNASFHDNPTNNSAISDWPMRLGLAGETNRVTNPAGSGPGTATANTMASKSNQQQSSISNNGTSLPSFEEIGMRTLATSGSAGLHYNSPGGIAASQNNHDPNKAGGGQFLLNRRPYFNTMMKTANTNHHPSTPLVKQKTAGCSSPRVQMYRTRVVYSDARDAIKAAAQEAAV